jgi:hypothetical protein
MGKIGPWGKTRKSERASGLFGFPAADQLISGAGDSVRTVGAGCCMIEAALCERGGRVFGP